MTNALKQYVAKTSTSVKPLEDGEVDYKAEWPLIDALMGGTTTMREAGEKFLPRWPMEDAEAYDARLKSSTLYNVFRRTVNVLAGKPFSGEPVFDRVDEEFAGWLQDVDLQGNNLLNFARDVLRRGLAKGLCHVLVDFPRSEPGATLADERAQELRPYLVLIQPERVKGYRTERVNGVLKLAEVVLSFHRTQPIDGDPKKGQERVEQLLIIKRLGGTPPSCAWELYELPPGAQDWLLVSNGPMSVPEIPLVTFYAEREGFFCARPPLLDLAHLNAQHWRSSSDQDTILHVARVPILFGSGFEEGTDLTIGSSNAIRTSNQDAKLQYVEHSGAAVDAGRQSLEDLEHRMAALGAELLLKRQTGEKSATEAAIESAAATCDLAAIVESLEDAFNLAFLYMTFYAKKPTEPSVTFFKDFAVEALGAADMDVLLKLNSVGAVSSRTLVEEAKRRKLLREEVDFEQEQEWVMEEAETVAERGQLLAPPGDEDLTQPPGGQGGQGA